MNISTQKKYPKQQNTTQIQQLCPLECSIAFCLNQLRSAKIQFLNLGNLVICPKQICLIIFKYKMLIRIDTLTNKQHTAQNLKIRCADGS